MKCPYCKGTGEECGCGQGKCDHCIDGVVADYPLGQPKRVTRILPGVEVTALAQYWSSSTRIETLGEFIDRVAYQAVETYKNSTASKVARTKTLFDVTYQEHLAGASQWLEQNKIRLHAAGCTALSPSARCSCGLHKVLTDVNAVLNHMKDQANGQEAKAAEGDAGTPTDGS